MITFKVYGNMFHFYKDGECIAKVQNWFGITELLKQLNIQQTCHSKTCEYCNTLKHGICQEDIPR